jgi:hypothetical protein
VPRLVAVQLIDELLHPASVQQPIDMRLQPTRAAHGRWYLVRIEDGADPRLTQPRLRSPMTRKASSGEHVGGRPDRAYSEQEPGRSSRAPLETKEVKQIAEDAVADLSLFPVKGTEDSTQCEPTYTANTAMIAEKNKSNQVARGQSSIKARSRASNIISLPSTTRPGNWASSVLAGTTVGWGGAVAMIHSINGSSKAATSFGAAVRRSA